MEDKNGIFDYNKIRYYPSKRTVETKDETERFGLGKQFRDHISFFTFLGL